MECNRLIKAILKNNNINCTQNVFEIFCLFANGILSFNDVLEASKKDNINFKEMCEENGFNFEMIANRQ
jgi:hypothetical protein